MQKVLLLYIELKKVGLLKTEPGGYYFLGGRGVSLGFNGPTLAKKSVGRLICVLLAPQITEYPKFCKFIVLDVLRI